MPGVFGSLVAEIAEKYVERMGNGPHGLLSKQHVFGPEEQGHSPAIQPSLFRRHRATRAWFPHEVRRWVHTYGRSCCTVFPLIGTDNAVAEISGSVGRVCENGR